MANDMQTLYAQGQNVGNNNRAQDPVIKQWNASAFFTAFGKPTSKVTHRSFTKVDGKTPIEGLQWAQPFFANINSVYVGKKLASEGFDLKAMAKELQNKDTEFIIRVRQNANEAYMTRPQDVVEGSADDLFK